jgi:hypothetical protein
VSQHVSRIRIFRKCILIFVGHLEGEKLYLINEYNTKQATKRPKTSTGKNINIYGKDAFMPSSL